MTFRYNNKPLRAIQNVSLSTILRQWRHYCHVVTGENYTLYLDGEVLASGPVEVDDRILPLNGTFIVGQEQDTLSGGMNENQILKGYVTQIDFWSYGLLDKDVDDIAKCKRKMLGDVYSSERDATELFNVEHKTLPLSELCRKEEFTVVFPELRTFEEAEEICHLIKTDIYTLNTAKNNNDSHDLASEKHCHRKKMWLGLIYDTDSDAWRKISDGEVISRTNFARDQPDNPNKEKCVLMDTKTGLWSDYTCHTNKACTLCGSRSPSLLYLRGACRNTKTETMFEVNGYLRDKPLFHGYYGFMIMLDENLKWTLFDTTTNESLARVSADTPYPLGKHDWVLAKPLCDHSPGEKLQLSLSACQDGQFMCQNGECIDVGNRCDGTDDCKDETDEQECNILMIPTGYIKSKLPSHTNHHHSESFKPILLFHFLRFLDIDDVRHTVSLEMTIAIKWKDTRLMYRNLKPQNYNNMLLKTDEIWRPVLLFPNVRGGEVNLHNEHLYVERTGAPKERDHNSVDMGIFFLFHLFYLG